MTITKVFQTHRITGIKRRGNRKGMIRRRKRLKRLARVLCLKLMPKLIRLLSRKINPVKSGRVRIKQRWVVQGVKRLKRSPSTRPKNNMRKSARNSEETVIHLVQGW